MPMRIDPTIVSPAKKELEDKKSTRTTFKLSQEGIDALSKLSKGYGLNTKEVIGAIWEWFRQGDELEKHLFDMMKNKKDTRLKVRKTYVLAKGVLDGLQSYSSANSVPRDAVLDTIAVTYLFFTEHFKKERRKNVVVFLDEFVRKLDSFAWQGEKQADGLFEEDDAIRERMSAIVTIISNFKSDLEAYLSDGVEIEPDF